MRLKSLLSWLRFWANSPTDDRQNVLDESEVWCVVANIKKEHKFGEGGKETRIGTRQFRGGTKVYISGCYPGMCDSVVVIGLHRKSRKFIVCVVDVKHVENFRAKVVYKPRVIELIRRDERCRVIARHEAERWVSAFPEWQEM